MICFQAIIWGETQTFCFLSLIIHVCLMLADSLKPVKEPDSG